VKTCVRWSVLVGTAVALAAASPASALAAPAAPGSTTSASVATAVDRAPVGWSARLEAAESRTGVERSPANAAVRRVIDPSDYECGATQLDAYFGTLLAGLDAAEIEFLLTSGVLDFPTYDALLFGTSDDPAYALPHAYRQPLRGSFRDAQRFWDIQSADVQLLSMHGDAVLQDRGGRGRVRRRRRDDGGLDPRAAGRRQPDLHPQRLRLHR
jgi:hypothetical protein